MISKFFLGVDNGITGSIAIVNIDGTYSWTGIKPTKSEQNYTKSKQNITRINATEYEKLLLPFSCEISIIAILERPMVNPTRFKATTSALRCLEAELIVFENLGFPYIYVDSKEWQREYFPALKKGEKRPPGELKKLSLEIGNRLFPKFQRFKHPDRDGLLIAEWARRQNK